MSWRLLLNPSKLNDHGFADQRRLGQILKDAYNGTVQPSQTEQLAHAVAQQSIKVHDTSCLNARAKKMYL